MAEPPMPCARRCLRENHGAAHWSMRKARPQLASSYSGGHEPVGVPSRQNERGDEAMTIQEVLLPLFLEVILTFLLLFWLAPLRGRDFSSGVTRAEDVSLREPQWSQRSLQVSYSYSNQFEPPVLFSVLTILAYFTRR